ncbi:MAG: flagellar hook basal-body protein [Planctomycetota bacterium]
MKHLGFGLTAMIAIGTLGLTGCGEPEGAAAASAKLGPATERSMEPARDRYEQTLEGVYEAYNVVLDNLAHAQTPGYRAMRPIFETVSSQETGKNGVMLPVMLRDPSPGRPVKTGRWLDVAISGAGYLILDDPDAGGVDGLAYSRAGQLYISPEGKLVAGSPTGPRLEPIVVFPDDFQDIRITTDGTVQVLAGARPRWTPIGQIHLARFANDAGLAQARTGRYVATAESGPPIVDTPGGLGLGTLQHKHLEGSNVDIHAELAELNQLKAWGESLADGLGVQPEFEAAAPAAATWSAVIGPPAPRSGTTVSDRVR